MLRAARAPRYTARDRMKALVDSGTAPCVEEPRVTGRLDGVVDVDHYLHWPIARQWSEGRDGRDENYRRRGRRSAHDCRALLELL